MFSDVFSQKDAAMLLFGKKIWFLGSSNMRAIYKDLIWLLERGDLATQDAFRTKNEERFLNDKRISNDKLHNGVNYVETRVYGKEVYLFFHFLTRLYLDDFVKMVEKTPKKQHPDIIFINSTLWDLSRWGAISDCIKNFKVNVMKTFKLLRSSFPTTRIIWKTSLPVSPNATGSIFTDEVKSVVPMLPWHLIEANRYAATTATFFNIDTLDLHHYMRMQGYMRVKDGIHWDSGAVRFMTNVFLTHISLCWNVKLPGYFEPSEQYLSETSLMKLEDVKMKERINKKQTYFDKIYQKAKKVLNPFNVNKFNNPIAKAKRNFKNNKKKLVNKIKNTFNVNRDRPNPVYSQNFENNSYRHANYNNYYNPSPNVNTYDYLMRQIDSQIHMVYQNIQANKGYYHRYH